MSTNPIPNGINSHEPEGHPPGAFIVNPYDAKKYAKSVAPNGGLINQAVQDIHFFAPISDPPPGTYLGPLNDVKEAMPKFLTPLNIRGLKLKKWVTACFVALYQTINHITVVSPFRPCPRVPLNQVSNFSFSTFTKINLEIIKVPELLIHGI